MINPELIQKIFDLSTEDGLTRGQRDGLFDLSTSMFDYYLGIGSLKSVRSKTLGLIIGQNFPHKTIVDLMYRINQSSPKKGPIK